MTTGFSPAMEDWARRQRQHLADIYMHLDICDRGDAEAYFERTAAKWHLLVMKQLPPGSPSENSSRMAT